MRFGRGQARASVVPASQSARESTVNRFSLSTLIPSTRSSPAGRSTICKIVKRRCSDSAPRGRRRRRSARCGDNVNDVLAFAHPRRREIDRVPPVGASTARGRQRRPRRRRRLSRGTAEFARVFRPAAALPGLASRGCAKHGSPMSNVEVELKTDTGERAPRSAGAATTSHTTQNRHRMALRSAIACRAVH